MAMAHPRVTVILTSYNRTVLLERAIQSVLQQNWGDFELIIIDDGSPQETRAIIENYAARDSRIIYIQTDKKDEDRRKTTDYATNINTALRIARGEYITYLTCDDEYTFDHVYRLVYALDTHSEWDIVFDDQIAVYYDDTTDSELPAFERILPQVVVRASCQVDHNQPMMRKECVFHVGLWDDHVMHYGAADAVFWNRLNDAGYVFYRVPGIGTKHRFHKHSIQGIEQ